jgi:formiminoglutamase
MEIEYYLFLTMNDWIQNYIAPKPWSGRIDGGGQDTLRWHQQVSLHDLAKGDIEREHNHSKSSVSEDPLLTDFNVDDVSCLPGRPVALMGFVSDEGVLRNQGRAGAREGPQAIRSACFNLPVHQPEAFSVTDFGDVVCIDNNLEQAQQALSALVSRCQYSGYRTLLFGGGHEITWPHYLGLTQAWSGKTIGVINIDAHFDNRPVDPGVGPTSGTGFWQIARVAKPFRYLAVGIQSGSNTRQLFNTAQDAGTLVIPAEDVRLDRLNKSKRTIRLFADRCDILYVTLCMDVFSAAFAPGVSAPAGSGLLPDAVFMELWDYIVKLPGVVALDVAEVCPALDQDHRTARLAAALVFRYLNA